MDSQNKGRRPDYTCLDEVVDSVFVIDELPGGFGQKAQKLAEPIEVIKTKVVDVGDDLRKPFKLSGRMLTAKQVDQAIKRGEFSLSMVPKVRHCRDCGAELPADRHLHCRSCLPTLPEDLAEFQYCGVSGE